MTDALTELFASIGGSFRAVLGDQLVALYAYGSGADGTYLTGFSDLDLAAFCVGLPGRDALIRLGRSWAGVDLGPFTYLQIRYIDAQSPAEATFVRGSVRPITAPVADLQPYLYDDASLAAYAGRWLAGLGALVDDDLRTWSVCAGRDRRLRHVRLVMTRVKPTVRSLLTRAGVPATLAFSTSWSEAISLLREFDAAGAEILSSVVCLLPPDDDGAVGRACELALRFLVRVVDEPVAAGG